LPPRFFRTPQTGRRIVAGFSYIQRIAKNAQTHVWYAPDLIENTVSWAAVRQFEILQEADNLAIDELDVANMPASYRHLMKMRAGGYRLTMITLGHYAPRAAQDDLDVLDRKIQEEITRLIHFLYLAETSEAMNNDLQKKLTSKGWNLEEALPHIAHIKRREEVFFDILAHLDQSHILHETAIGLQLPEATKEKNWPYCAAMENRFLAFQQAITNIFQNLDKTRAPMTHMRGYGDHMRPS